MNTQHDPRGDVTASVIGALLALAFVAGGVTGWTVCIFLKVLP